MRISSTDATPIFLQQILTGTLDPVEWVDTQVIPGENYGYFVVPIHTEMKLSGEFVEGPPTKPIIIQIPALEVTPDNGNGWTIPGLEDWLNPGNETNQDNPPPHWRLR